MFPRSTTATVAERGNMVRTVSSGGHSASTTAQRIATSRVELLLTNIAVAASSERGDMDDASEQVPMERPYPLRSELAALIGASR